MQNKKKDEEEDRRLEVADLGSGHCQKFASWAPGPQGLHLLNEELG